MWWLSYLNAAETQEFDNWAWFRRANPGLPSMPERVSEALDRQLGEGYRWLLDLWREELAEANPERAFFIVRDYERAVRSIEAREALR